MLPGASSTTITPNPLPKLIQWDERYDKKSQNCPFRSFLFSICPTEQANAQIAFYRNQLASEGIHLTDEQWTKAAESVPDASRMFPLPVHFFSGLQERIQLQTETLRGYVKLVQQLYSVAESTKQAHDEMTFRLRKLSEKHTALQRSVLLLLGKIQVLRRVENPLTSEAPLLKESQNLCSTIEDTQPQTVNALDKLEKTPIPAGNTESEETHAVQCDIPISEVVDYLREKQHGIQHLSDVLERDMKEVKKLIR